MYYAITFENEAGVRKNTWDDWHIVPSSRPVIAPPEPKTSYVDIPGASGSIDFTTALVNHPLYKDREGTFEFIVLNGYNIWHELYSDIMTFLNGQKVKLYLEETPDYYYEGRITISEWNSTDHPRSKIKMKYKVMPFQTGTTKVTKTLTLDGTAAMQIQATELDPAPVSPIFRLTGDGITETTVSYTDVYTVKEVIPYDEDIKFPSIIFYGKPEYQLTFDGKGDITVSIEKRRL